MKPILLAVVFSFAHLAAGQEGEVPLNLRTARQLHHDFTVETARYSEAFLALVDAVRADQKAAVVAALKTLRESDERRAKIAQEAIRRAADAENP
jgi:hypothetical protein